MTTASPWKDGSLHVADHPQQRRVIVDIDDVVRFIDLEVKAMAISGAIRR
jgi:hypothetical protein